MSTSKELLQSFKASPLLVELEAHLNEFNMFEAAGLEHREIYHSTFLAYLLSPNGNHGLADSLLRALLKESHSSENFDVLDLSGTKIRREWRNIDILAVNDECKLVVAIENKIHTGEHDDQLARYHDEVTHYFSGYRIECLFLTPFGGVPSHKRYRSVTYEFIAHRLSQVLSDNVPPLDQGVRETIWQYVKMLRRQILRDPETERLCLEIYRQHRKSIELILKHLPSRQTRIQDLLVALITNDNNLISNAVVTRSAVTQVTFLPKSWEHLAPRIAPDPWSPSGHAFFFGFSLSARKLDFSLQIRYESYDILHRFSEIAASHPPLLKPGSGSAKYRYRNLYERTILSDDRMDAASLEAHLDTITAWWTEFLATDFHQIEAIFSGVR
ncbi:MAG TPA: PD-(D/E)XK nuclease family protein [Capsulimonadaceae bacterium]|jgi:hypothetical protein